MRQMPPVRIIREEVSYISDQRIPFNMISNGRAIDDDFLDFLASKHGSIGISVPGIKTFKDHTGIDNVTNVLQLFRKTKARGIRTSANVTVTKKNIGELYENLALATRRVEVNCMNSARNRTKSHLRRYRCLPG